MNFFMKQVAKWENRATNIQNNKSVYVVTYNLGQKLVQSERSFTLDLRLHIYIGECYITS